MSDKKIIAVVGATGAQGGGLIQAILHDPNSPFRVRAITRNAASPKAEALIAQGVEVVEADLDNPESLTQAFEGAYGAFCVTFFWAHYSPEIEQRHAQNMAIAAKEANLQHVIWSTLEDTRNWVPLADNRMPTLQGNYKVPHFDGKGASDKFFTELGVPTTFLLTSFYWENLIYFGMGVTRGEDGILGLTIPMGEKKLAGIAASDIGKCTYGILKKGSQYIGKAVAICGDQPTIPQMAAALSQALGEPVRHNDISPEVYRSFGFPGADDLGNMFQFYQDFEDYFCGIRNPEIARELNPALKSFEQWVMANRHMMVIDTVIDSD